MAYAQGSVAHRYLGHGNCVEVRVIAVTDDGRATLEDGSVINRFTQSYYHTPDKCHIPRLRVLDGGDKKVNVKFPVVIETRINQSSQPTIRGPYHTDRMDNGSFKCDCPWRQYHPADDCRHIKEWKQEIAQGG